MCGQESSRLPNWPMPLSVNASRMVGKYTLSSNMVIVLCTHSVEIRVFRQSLRIAADRPSRQIGLEHVGPVSTRFALSR